MSVASRAELTSQTHGLRAWVAKRPVISFYLLTLTLSWGYWLTLLVQGRRVVPGGGVTHFPGLLGPMLAAMAVTAVIGGRKALHELFGRMFRLGPHWPSKLMLAFSPLALGAVVFAAMQILGKRLSSVDTFAHGRFRATLFVALLWSLWHLPLFWLNLHMAALVGPVLIGWLFALVCGAFVLAQVYLTTGHSNLCVARWHAGFNMMVATEAGTGLPAAIVSTVVMAWGFIVAVRWWRRPPDPPSLDPLLDPVTPRAGAGERGL